MARRFNQKRRKGKLTKAQRRANMLNFGADFKQVGKSDFFVDKKLKALPAGWRVSKASGKLYFENRKNRSDKKGMMV